MTDGQVLAGRYELGAVLGRGGMAEVRAGWDRRLSRAVAIKTLLPDLAERPGIRARFEGEARAAARLAHPNAVAVFDVGEEEGVGAGATDRFGLLDLLQRGPPPADGVEQVRIAVATASDLPPALLLPPLPRVAL